MTGVIQQSVTLKAPPEELFDSFLDSRKHTAFTGGMPAKVSRKAGGTFTAFGGQIRGRNLLILPKRMIVQTWRADHWKAEDPDSILILCFAKARGGGRIDLTHVNVPAHDRTGVTAGWPRYYWQPWKAYLSKR